MKVCFKLLSAFSFFHNKETISYQAEAPFTKLNFSRRINQQNEKENDNKSCKKRKLSGHQKSMS